MRFFPWRSNKPVVYYPYEDADNPLYPGPDKAYPVEPFGEGGIVGWIARHNGASATEVEALRWAALELPDSSMWKAFSAPPTEPPSEECQALLREVGAKPRKGIPSYPSIY